MYLNVTCILVEDELYMYIQSHACIVVTYTATHYISAKSKHNVVLHQLRKTWQNTEFTVIHYNYTGPLTHNVNMYLLCALIQLGVRQHQETAVSHISVFRESVSDSHNQFSCCIIDHLLLVGGSIRTISLPTR